MVWKRDHFHGSATDNIECEAPPVSKPLAAGLSTLCIGNQGGGLSGTMDKLFLKKISFGYKKRPVKCFFLIYKKIFSEAFFSNTNNFKILITSLI